MDKAKKKQLKKILTWASLALVVALLAAMPLIARQEAEADGPVASILSAEVKKGSISSTIRGGGNILAETVEDVKLPTGVKIEGFLVKNGQFVKEDQPLAQVDKVSVMTAITEVNETLDFLREELEAARNEKVSASVKATAGGRVKKIFAQAGESVQDVMLRDGALAILSLDGLMAVKLERALPLTTGESVTVTLAGGEEVTGRVESNLDSVVVITVEDEGYEVGQTVTVTDEDGKRLGQAQLYIHNAWKATAYTGTIESVNAKEEKTLSSGATLFTLKDRDYEGELRRRANQHREYEDLLQELFQMYESGYLYAPCDGEVEGVDSDSVHLLNATPEGWVLAPLNNEAAEGEHKGWTVMLLSNETGCNKDCTISWDDHTDPNRDPKDCPALCQDSNCHINTNTESAHTANCITNCKHADTVEGCTKGGYHYEDCISGCTSADTDDQCTSKKHKSDCIRYCKEADGVTRLCDGKKHKLTCIGACNKTADGSCPANPYHHADCIKKCNKTMDCPANVHDAACPHKDVTYTARVGLVVRVAAGVVEYTYESAESVSATKSGSGYVISGKPNAKTMVNGPAFVPSNGVSCKAGDIILIITGTKGSAVVVSDLVYVYSSSSMAMPDFDMSGMAGMMGGFDISGMMGGFAGFGNYGAMAPAEDEGLFDLEGNTLLTVTAHDNAELVISIDEHDISRLSTGMKAKVRVDALKGQEFEAEVTSIAVSGTNKGGSSKFAVTLKLPMSENMLSGMSASAVIELEEKQDILLIPAEALVQQGARTVVFTALGKDSQPSGPVEVETGLSDGLNVEILSGLAEGQKIYYSYYDTVELNTSAEAQKYTFG